jgi:hypothetical protein
MSARTRVGFWLIAAWLGASASVALAQGGATEVVPAPGPLTTCLTSASKQPVYPEAAAGTVVRVLMQFDSATEPPRVDVKFNNGGAASEKAVLDHVGTYRLPCLKPGSSAMANQEFQFVSAAPASKVLEAPLRDDTPDTRVSKECLRGIRDAPKPDFPERRLIGSTQDLVQSGIVLTRMTFSRPDGPPAVEILYDGGDRRLAAAVESAIEAYRLPCAKVGDKPIVATQNFQFVYDGEDLARLKPKLSLVQLLTLVKDMNTQKVRFDLTTMGCPFEVDVTAYRPYTTNRVAEVGPRDPNRREFIEWLRAVTFEFPPAVKPTAIGSSSRVTVPCALLDFS